MTLRSFLNSKINEFEISRGYSRLTSRPVSLLIEASDKCNSFCIMCAHPKYRSKKKLGHMPMEIFEKTKPFWKSAKDVVLAGNGEGALNPLYIDMAKRLKAEGAWVHTFTNGSVLKPEISEQLVAIGFDMIHVSFAGATAGTYKKIRGVDWFDKITRDLEELRKIKKRCKAKKPLVRFNITAMNSVIDELSDTVTLAARLGVCGIDMPQLASYFDNVAPESPWLDVETTREKLAGAVAVGRDCGIEVRPPVLVERELFCKAPFSSMNVRIDGTITTCTGYRFVIGDLRQKSIEKVWNDTPITGFRRDILEQGYKSVCPGCSEWDARAEVFVNTSPGGSRTSILDDSTGCPNR